MYLQVNDDSETVYAIRRTNFGVSDDDEIERAFRSVPSAGSNDNGFSLVRVERQAVQKKPVIDCIAAIRKRWQRRFVAQRNVELGIVRILRMADVKTSNDIRNRRDIECEKQRADGGSLWDPVLAGFSPRLTVSDTNEL